MRTKPKVEKTDPKKIVPGDQPPPEQLIPANEQIGQDILNGQEKRRPGRPAKDSAQRIIEEPEKKPPVKYPDPTPETNMMAETMVKTLCGAMAMALGDHCAFDPSRDSMMVDAWSRYFSFKGLADFPPIYMAIGATAIYATRVLSDPKTKENLAARRKAKIEAAQRSQARNN